MKDADDRCLKKWKTDKTDKVFLKQQWKVSSLSDHSLYKLKKNLNEPETHFWALGLRAASVIWLHQVYFV